MRKSLFILIFLNSINLIAQNDFIKMPENATEIHFVYEIKSNYFVNENGVYADSLLFAVDFPELKTEKKINPIDSTKFCVFVPFKDLNKERKKYLWSKIYHTNETVYGVYNIHNKKTVFKVKREDENTRLIFKKYFSEPYYNFKYTQKFNYKTRVEKFIYPNIEYEYSFDKVERTIINNNNKIGYFNEIKGNVEYKNIIYLNDNLSKFITPQIFTNNEFGIEKIETINETITLKSVSYK